MPKASLPRESFVKIFLSEAELQKIRLAAAVVGAKGMSSFCRDLIVAEAERVIAPLNVAAAVKAAKKGK
jgi:hypothetical protein